MPEKKRFRLAVFQPLLMVTLTLTPVVLMNVAAVFLSNAVYRPPGIDSPVYVWLFCNIVGVLFSFIIGVAVSFQVRKRIVSHLKSLLSVVRGFAESPLIQKMYRFGIPGFDEIADEVERMIDTVTHHEQVLEQQLEDHDKAHQETNERLRTIADRLLVSEKTAALGELVSGVTHEINTPLSIGVTAASFLNERSQVVLRAWDEQTLTQEGLERFLKDSEETSRIIHKNLDQAAQTLVTLTQIATDQQLDEKRNFDVGEYLKDILLSLRHRLKSGKHRANLIVEETIRMNSYPSAITQIVNNLVMNSIIHGFREFRGGIITIRLDRAGDSVLMRYSDNGRGLRDDEFHRIFDPFYTTLRGRGGTGLGMNIVYNLVVEKLSGSIRVERPEEGGTGFLLTFPDLPEDAI